MNAVRHLSKPMVRVWAVIILSAVLFGEDQRDKVPRNIQCGNYREAWWRAAFNHRERRRHLRKFKSRRMSTSAGKLVKSIRCEWRTAV